MAPEGIVGSDHMVLQCSALGFFIRASQLAFHWVPRTSVGLHWTLATVCAVFNHNLLLNSTHKFSLYTANPSGHSLSPCSPCFFELPPSATTRSLSLLQARQSQHPSPPSWGGAPTHLSSSPQKILLFVHISWDETQHCDFSCPSATTRRGIPIPRCCTSGWPLLGTGSFALASPSSLFRSLQETWSVLSSGTRVRLTPL